MCRWRVLCVSMILVTVFCGVAAGRDWGIGISSEPMDIAGGGFFLDSYVELPILRGTDSMGLAIRSSLGVGPLPIDPKILFVDVLGVWRMSIGDVGMFAGLGPSFMVATSFNWTQLDGVAVVGLDNIAIGDRVTVYIELKIRGTGFFISPGVGMVFNL